MLGALSSLRRSRDLLILDELAGWLRLPNDVEDADAIRRNAGHLQAMLERRGVRAECWATASGRPFVFGELTSPGARETVLIYSHYDGVPAGEGWHSGPYEPILRAGAADTPALPWPCAGSAIDPSWRLYARSAADSKNAIVAVLAALDTLQAAGLAPALNLKFLFDGEEERESPGLAGILERHGARLHADLVISASGELHQSGLPTIAFGVRGVSQVRLTMHGAAIEAHSGHFGGFAPNAAVRLAHLVAALVDAEGRVLLPGYGDDAAPLDAASLAAIAAVPATEAAVAQRLGMRDLPADSLQALINRPTFNLRGLSAGGVGAAARNVVPATAVAEFDLRLVAGMDPQRVFEQLRQAIAAQGYAVTGTAPDAAALRRLGPTVQLEQLAGFPATRTPLGHPLGRRIVERLRALHGDALVVEPTEGGSLAFHHFARAGMPVVTLPISNDDCNQHSHDENLLLSTLYRGVDQWLAILAATGQSLPTLQGEAS
jgi:acetylornithine deacetylase/succinyl-diaminopimelate desuccinylase-like protein